MKIFENLLKQIRSFSFAGLSGAVDHFLMSYSNQIKALHGEMDEGGVSRQKSNLWSYYLWDPNRRRLTVEPRPHRTKHCEILWFRHKIVNGLKQMKKLASVIDVENVHLILCLHQRSTGANKLKLICKTEEL